MYTNKYYFFIEIVRLIILLLLQLRLIVFHLFQGMDTSTIMTPDVRIIVSDDSLSVQVHSSPTSNVVYKDKFVWIKRRFGTFRVHILTMQVWIESAMTFFKEHVAFKEDKN